MEKPVRSPIVPPTVARILVNLAALSMVTRSKVGVSKKILTKLRLFGSWKSKKRSITGRLYAIKTEQKARKALSFFSLELCLYSIKKLAPAKS